MNIVTKEFSPTSFLLRRIITRTSSFPLHIATTTPSPSLKRTSYSEINGKEVRKRLTSEENYIDHLAGKGSEMYD